MSAASASVTELAADWLTAKRALESAAQAEKGNSDRAREADLERWAIVLGEARGRSPTEDQPALAALTLSDLSEDVLVGAVAEAKRRWSDATVARMPLNPPGLHPMAAPLWASCRGPTRRRPLPSPGTDRHRTGTARLGYAVQLGCVRFLGCFPDLVATPAAVVSHVATVVDVDPVAFAGYPESRTRFAHAVEIRTRYGYTPFGEGLGHWRFLRLALRTGLDRRRAPNRPGRPGHSLAGRAQDSASRHHDTDPPHRRDPRPNRSPKLECG